MRLVPSGGTARWLAADLVREPRTKLACADILRGLTDVIYPDAEKIVLIMDNLNIHQAACLYECFELAEARHIAERFEWHYMPEHDSWLNMAEIELSVLKLQCLHVRLPNIATVHSDENNVVCSGHSRQSFAQHW